MYESIGCTALEAELKESLSERRYRHSLAVAQTCLQLDTRYLLHLDQAELYVAALMHDMAREWSKEQLVDYALAHNLHLLGEEREYPVLLHAPVAASLLSARGFSKAVCTAVRYHSLGSIHMGLMGLLVYVSDYLEPNRTHLGQQDRERLLAFATPEELSLAVLEQERVYLASKDKQISACSEELYRFLCSGGKF
jgi:predicted HD superfamily hydrolase involved in NAD metabolism